MRLVDLATWGIFYQISDMCEYRQSGGIIHFHALESYALGNSLQRQLTFRSVAPFKDYFTTYRCPHLKVASPVAQL